MGRRTPLILALLGLAIGLVVVLAWDDVIAPALGVGGSTDGDDLDGEMLLDEEAELEALRRRAGLRGLPAAELAGGGRGVLRGAVFQYVPGGEPRPLPNVELLVLGHDGKKEWKYTPKTAEDGTFEQVEVQALFGYLIAIRHPPFREKRLKGITVRRDRVTDLGAIVLGAPTTLSGEVRTAEGGPPRGAVVQVFPDTSRPDSFDLRRGLFELQAAFDPLGEADVDGDGRFVISDLPPGRYLLRVQAPGYATAFRGGVVVTLDERSTSPRITLDRGAGFFGRVLDEDGNGIGGARLLALMVPGERARRVDRIDAISEPDGSYRLDMLTPGVRYFVEAWSEGYAPFAQLAMAPGGVVERDFQLLRSGRVEGRVTDARTGDGIGGVEVTVVAGSFVRMSPVSAVTDASGYYALPNVSEGPVIVFSASALDYQPADDVSMKAVKGLEVVAGETTVIDWSLELGGRISGVVKTREGTPVAYATVALIDTSRRWAGELTALSDIEGVYAVTGVRPATYEVQVSAPGYSTVTETGTPQIVVPEDLTPVTHDLILAQGATIHGVVTNPEGTPMAGAQVRIKAQDTKDAGKTRDLVAISGSGGRYTLAGVPPQAPVHVIAEHDSFVRVMTAPVRLSPGQRLELDLALRPGVRVRGRAVDARGRGVPEARVRWGNVDDAEDRRLRDAFRADEYLGQRVVYTDADGVFVLENLEPGRTLVKVEHEGYAPWYRKDLLVPESGDVPLLNVELSGALEISGRVVSEKTRIPIGDVVVYCRERRPLEGVEEDPGKVKALVTTNTNDNGRYTLSGVPPGRYEVVAWFAPGGYIAAAQDWRSDRVRKKDVEAGSKGVDFFLVTEADIAGDTGER